jgi:hypothetical protein
MLTTQSGWALLAQGSAAPKEIIMRAKVLRRFWMAGALIEPGKTVEIHEGLARELLSSQKIELVTDEEDAKVGHKSAAKSEPKKEK